MNDTANLDAIEKRTLKLTAAATSSGYIVSLEGFVSETCASELIGIALSTIRDWRATERHGLRFRRLGGRRGRVQYSLGSIAAFLIACEADT